MPFTLPPLYPILDEAFLPAFAEGRGLYLQRVVRELAEAGVTLLQLRAKRATREQLLHDAAAVRAAAPASMRLILNDRVELVRESGFDGVHLGQGDLDIEAARQRLGPAATLGLSTHTAEQVEAAEQTSADYVAIGPVSATATKTDAEAPVGLDGVRAARFRTRKPLVAIGGMTLASAASAWAAGADSVAVIGALFSAEATLTQTPAEIARDFLRLFR